MHEERKIPEIRYSRIIGYETKESLNGMRLVPTHRL